MAVKHGGNIFAVADRDGVDFRQVLDFSASINPLGPSPAAREAILRAVDRIAHYPERDATRLRTRLAAEWGVERDRVLVGNGATELLFAWCRHAGTGTIAAPAFGEFHHAWPDASFCELGDESTWPAIGPVVLTRPANPTGTIVDAAVIRKYSACRSDAVLVDESFLDFVAHESLLPYAVGNLFVLRSLTKFWALPGLRIGALVGDVKAIAQEQPPWAVNVLAEEAVLASLEDRAFADSTRRFVAAESAWFANELANLPGLNVWPSSANFLYIETAEAARLTTFAANRRVLVRDCSDWPGFARPSIRVAVRRRWENEVLLSVFREMLCV